MDVREALKSQYHAAFRMLRECVDLCPDDLWTAGEYPRYFWKIAYHAAFYGHLYMGQDESAFKPWSRHQDAYQEVYIEDAVECEALTQADVKEYIDEIIGMVDATIDGVDLDAPDSGFHWYKSPFPKLDHEVLSIRHVQGHVGQLSELLMQRGVETNWYSRRA